MLIPLRWSSQTDEQLMKRAANGSDRAFEELYNRYARRLQGFFARRLNGDAELAADLMHDTFLRLYDARSRYREGESFRAWLFTIAYNLCKNQQRNADLFAATGTPSLTDDSCDIELQLDTAILHDALREVLAALPDPYALLFSLHYEEELTIPQIARITQLPDGTVKSRLHKAMTIIKQQLKPYENH